MASGGTEVARAYVTIIPKSDGNFSKTVGKEIGGSLDGASGAVSAKSVALGNIMSNAILGAVSKVADGVTAVIGGAFENFADYEQLVGGVDTLFKESSAAVQENAKKAFATAGMSANEYMENVTSFSASLLQSLDGDTAEAARIADMAMVDMSDNANKMGSDMESITNAYQGFAKQNYTMLDNLKLGYGGTKSEMERLLKDAGEIAGVEFNIDSYSDVIQAIHVMQESMDIAGTTMEEGSTTISGSMNQLHGAWENFLTAIGDGGESMDLSQVTSDLITSLGAVGSNVLPAIARIGQSIALELPGIMADALAGVPAMVQEMVTGALGEDAGSIVGEMFAGFESAAPAVESAMSSIVGIVSQAVPVIQGAVMPVVSSLVPAVEKAVSTVVVAVTSALDFINANVMPTVTAVANQVMPVVEDVAGFVSEMLGEISEFVGETFGDVLGITEDVWPDVSTIIQTAVNLVKTVVTPVWNAVKSATSSTFNGVRSVVQTVWPTISNIIRTAVTGIKNVIAGISSVVGTVQGIFNRVKSAITDPINTAKSLISTAINNIKSLFSGLNIEIPKPRVPKVTLDGGEAPWGIAGKGRLPRFDVEWAAMGGIVDGATLIGAGERGAELIWPSYDPYMSRYAEAIADAMPAGGGITVNLNYTNDADAAAMARDVAWEIRRYELAGAF